MKLKLQLKLIIMQHLENNSKNEVMALKDLIYTIEENLHEIGMSKEEKACIVKDVFMELEKEERIHCFKDAIYQGVNFNSGLIKITFDNFEDLNGTFIDEVKLSNFQYTEDNTEYENILTEGNIERMVNTVIELGLADKYIEYSVSGEEESASDVKDDFSKKLIMLFDYAEYDAEEYVEDDYEEDEPEHGGLFDGEDEFFDEDDEIEYENYKATVQMEY